MMKRILCLLLVLACICPVFAGCSAKYEEAVFDEAFMVAKARKLADDVCTMAQSDVITALYNIPVEARDYRQLQGRKSRRSLSDQRRSGSEACNADHG